MSSQEELWYPPFLLGELCIAPTCTCANGSTGRSEWIDAVGALCQVNEGAVRALWILNMVYWTIAVFVGIPQFRQLYQRFIKNRKLSSLPPVALAILTMFLVTMPCVFVVGFVRIFIKDTRITLTPESTVPWFIGRTAFYLALGIHQPALLEKALVAESSTTGVVRFYTWQARMLCFITALNGFLFIPVYVTGGSDVVLARICFGIFLGIHTFCTAGILLSTVIIDDKLGKVLEKSYHETQSEAILILKEKLHQVQKTAKINGIMQCSLYFFWFVIPPLWVAHDYILPITWLSMPGVAFATLQSVFIKKGEEEDQITVYRNSKIGDHRLRISSRTTIPKDLTQDTE